MRAVTEAARFELALLLDALLARRLDEVLRLVYRAGSATALVRSDPWRGRFQAQTPARPPRYALRTVLALRSVLHPPQDGTALLSSAAEKLRATLFPGNGLDRSGLDLAPPAFGFRGLELFDVWFRRRFQALDEQAR